MGRDRYVPVGGEGDWIKWDQPGQVLEGEYRGMAPGKTAPDGKVMSYGTIDTADGVKRFSVTAVLKTRLEQVREGSGVFIEFLGKKRGQGGAEYKDFFVGVDKAENLVVPKEAAEPEEETPF